MKKLEEILNLPEAKKIIKKDEKEKATEIAEPFLRDMAEFDLEVWKSYARVAKNDEA